MRDQWAQDGTIEFCSASLRYAAGLPLAVQNFTLSIAAGERVGICGRTGIIRQRAARSPRLCSRVSGRCILVCLLSVSRSVLFTPYINEAGTLSIRDQKDVLDHVQSLLIHGNARQHPYVFVSG